MKYYSRLWAGILCAAVAVSSAWGARSAIAHAMAREAAQRYALEAERASAEASAKSAAAPAKKTAAESELEGRARLIDALRAGGETRRKAWRDFDRGGHLGNGGDLFDLGLVYSTGPYGLPANRARADYFFRMAEQKKELGAYTAHARALFCQNTPYSNARALACLRKGMQRGEQEAGKLGVRYFREVPPRTPYERALQTMYAIVAADPFDNDAFSAAFKKVRAYENPSDAFFEHKEASEVPTTGIAASSELTPEDIAVLKASAEKGDAFAMCSLALAYFSGWGCPVDNAAAQKWLDRGADAGNLDCLYYAGLRYQWGEGVPKNAKKALRYLSLAAERGEPLAMAGLGILYQDGGEGVPKNPELALRWLTRGAQGGNSSAQFALGMRYFAEKRFTESLYWFEVMADSGNTKMSNLAAAMYLQGTEVPKDVERGAYWALRAADDGGVNNLVMGQIYLKGMGVPTDVAAAAQYLHDAACENNTLSQMMLGRLYLDGNGVPRDYGKSVYWLRRAVNGGDKNAKRILEIESLQGVEPVKDSLLTPSLDYLDELAARGDAAALPGIEQNFPQTWVRAYMPAKPALYGTQIDTPSASPELALEAAEPKSSVTESPAAAPEPAPSEAPKPAPSEAQSPAAGTPEAGLAAYLAASSDPDFLETLARAYRNGDGVEKNEALADAYARRAEKARAAQTPAR